MTRQQIYRNDNEVTDNFFGKGPMPWEANPALDPRYPYRCYRNQDGVVMFVFPQECPNELPIDESEDARKYVYSWFPFPDKKYMPVRWEETNEKKWALIEKRWIEAEHRRNERRRKYEIPVAEFFGDGYDDDGNRNIETKNCFYESDDEFDDKKDFELDGNSENVNQGVQEEDDVSDEAKDSLLTKCISKEHYVYLFPRTEEQAINRIELEDVITYLREKWPRWWHVFYWIVLYGEKKRDYSKRMNLSRQRLEEIIDLFTASARAYRDQKW